MGERRGAYSILVERPVGIRPLVRPRHRGLDNIKMNLQEELVRLAQDRDRWRPLMNALMKLRVP